MSALTPEDQDRIEGRKVLERIRRDNKRAAERAAQWDRSGRTDEEILRAYEDNMAAKRTALAQRQDEGKAR